MFEYLDAMRRYFSFSGRSTRSQYWLFAFAWVMLLAVATTYDATQRQAVISFSTLPELLRNPGAAADIFYVVHVFPMTTVTVRRLHDVDKSGWWFLFTFLPFGGLVVLLLACVKSTPGPNRFGPPAVLRKKPKSQRADELTQQAVASTPPPTIFPPTLQVPISDEVVRRLETLASLRTSGAIDEAEFQSLKRQIIAGIPR